MTATNAGGCAQRREIGADGSGVDAEIAAPNRDDDRTSMRLPGQRRAYPDIVPLTVGLAPDTAFNRALDTAGRRGWTIVAADEAAARRPTNLLLISAGQTKPPYLRANSLSG
jgi:hypothetical protein